ncbi:Amidohydrolase 3 [Candidatus Koribacter versatilis Ellin345]|uniref:Amidohydrolase 3 n=1 Tax=Koribacter versatilis (strain Ellin345) TaxID=204669 RepID=Q1IT26_KORVE|nr:amidohydrolase family protein [Candidatus Koribacter versatilis]ABF39974.1 Amidohydrolase 3 [Candidatus Koribacter versatilis Ellin345]
MRFARFLLVCFFLSGAIVLAQQTATSGSFVLHKFARPIGSETYSIATDKDSYTLTSHFLFTDRGTKVPLETTFVAGTRDMAPRSFSAKGKPSRQAEMDDSVTVAGDTVSITRSGKSETQKADKSWFVVDGYSPVAMQEQMMRWWLKHGKPQEFTAYPSKATVRITPAGTLAIDGKATHGYTVSGLIWGQESLWMDDAQNLVALVSIDAEFDHFEAVREKYAKSLNLFIADAVKADLANLKKLSATARMAPSRRLAIVGATIEDSIAPPIQNGVILIEDGVIRAVGPKDQVTIPSDAKVLDATGKFAVPGLWDMHAHYEQVEWGPIYLAAGVTTVRDVGNEFEFIQTLHDELDRKQDPAIGPHLEFAGVIDGSGQLTIGVTIADTPEQAREWVDKYASAGARQIKIYSSVKPEIVKAITTEAHAKGMTVTGHIPEGMTAIQGIHLGMDQINHISYELQYSTRPIFGADGKPDRSKPAVLELEGARMKDLVSTLQAHHTVLDPTAALYESFSITVPLHEVEPGVDHLPPQLREALDSPPPTGDRAAIADARRKAIIATLRALHEAKVPIVAGTDQAIPGYSLHRELELYVEAGFTPQEAIQAATIEAARAVGVEKESGSLEAGKRGDVLLLNADPLADIHNTRKVWRTVAAGAVYDPAPLWQVVGFLP